MKRILVLILACLMILGGCKNETSEPVYPVESFNLSFAERPSKVLCLNPEGEEIIKVLGYGHALLDTESAFADKEYPKEGEIAALNPDFVIISEGTQESVKKALDEKGIKNITLGRFSSDDELLTFLEDISLIFEGSKDWELKKEQLGYYFNETSSALKAKAQEMMQANFEEAPTFLFVAGDNFAMTPDTMESKFLEEIGFVNLAEGRENYYVPFSELEKKPDILICPEHLETIPENLGTDIVVPYDYERILHQSPSVFSFRKEILEGIFGEEIVVENNFMPLPEVSEAEEEKKG